MTFHHTGDLGDISYALPTIKALGGGTLLFSPSSITREPMTEARKDFIAPLLLAQPYIKEARMRKGEAVKHDFAPFREGFVRHLGLAEMQRRCVIPYKRVDFSKPWLEVEKEGQLGVPVFHRSARYHNPVWRDIWPELVKRHPEARFVGTREEFTEFAKEFGGVRFTPVSNALQMASLIAHSTFFVGNQSFPYSVAEGLKHDSILEVWPECKNCHFERPNGQHIETIDQWNPSAKLVKMALALQFHPGETDAAKDLVELICENEKSERVNIEFWLFVRDDVDACAASEIAAIAATKFCNVRVIRSTRRGRGWPEGCNDLWQSCMTQAGRLHKEGKTDVEAVFTFEPDIVPLRADWIDRVQRDWIEARTAGKPISGLLGGVAGREHINGNAIFAVDIARRFPTLQASSGPWDAYHATLMIRECKPSDAMINMYQKQTITEAEIGLARKNPTQSLLHGVKDFSARSIIRAMIKGGSL